MMESYDLTDFADCGQVDMTFNKDKSFWSYHVFELQFMLLKRLKATTEFEPQAEKFCCHYFRWRSRTKGPQTQSRSHNHLMLPEVEGTDAVNRLHCPRPLVIMMHDHPHILMSLRLTWDNKASRRNWNHRGANLLMPMRNASTRCSHPSGLYILSLLLRQISKEWFESIKLREHKAFICISGLRLSVKPDTIVF